MKALNCERPFPSHDEERDYDGEQSHDGEQIHNGDRQHCTHDHRHSCNRGYDGNPSHDCDSNHDDNISHGRDTTDQRRRSVLRAGALGMAASLAGCLGGVMPGGDGEVPDPVALTGGLDCDVCGMVIEKHPGPNGQIFYEGDSPEGHDNPARFDSLKQCYFPYKLEHDELDWDLAAGYVTDYSSVEYDVSTQGGTTTISSHPEPDAFARAKDLQYVVNSEVEGAMGPDFIPFSTQGDAESFADEYGGEVVSYGDIGEGLVGR